jgi:NAD dependent epimerase/dehydratase
LDWSGKRVLVTGAGGFIGSHLTEALVCAGAATRALVHYNAMGNWGWLDDSSYKSDIDVVAGDICDEDIVEEATRDVEVVFHLAALIGIPYSYQAPESYVRTNIQGTLNVLKAVRRFEVDKLVHTSTSEVYGTAQYAPIDEAHPLQGQSPYAATKIGADKLVESFHCSFGLPVTTVRPFNTFGPRQSARAVIPTIITQCLQENAVTLGNLEPTRDLNYVGNTVEGFLRAGSDEGAVGRVFNLGSGREISIGELARLIIRLVGRPVELKTTEQRMRPTNSEVVRLLADSNLAEEVLGWQPIHTLEDGLELTIEWVRGHLEGYRSGGYVV